MGGLLLAVAGVFLIVIAFNKSWQTVWEALVIR